MNKQQTVAPKGKIFEAIVVSAKTPQTVIVSVESTHRHQLYKKAVRRTKRFAAHNEALTIAVGDYVRIQETKPISRTKHFVVLEKFTK